MGSARLIAKSPVAFEFVVRGDCFQWKRHWLGRIARVCGGRCHDMDRDALWRGGQEPLTQRLPAPEPRAFQAEFSVTAIFRVRIVDPLVAATALKVARKTPPCICKRGRWNPAFWNPPKASLRTFFDATVSHDRVHLRTIAIPLCLGSVHSSPSRWLRASVP